MTTDTLTTMSKTGLQALLTPKDSVLLLIDHQPFQFANLHSHEPTIVVNNVIGLAKTAKLFGVPTILTTVVEERGGAVVTLSVAVSHYALDRYRLRHRFEFGIVHTGQLTTKRETRAESLDFQILLLFTPLFLPVLRLRFLASKGSNCNASRTSQVF